MTDRFARMVLSDALAKLARMDDFIADMKALDPAPENLDAILANSARSRAKSEANIASLLANHPELSSS